MPRKSDVAKAKCARCGAKDVSEPRGEERYCHDCWEKKIAVDSIKRIGHEQITIQVQNADAKAPTQKLVDNFPSFVENLCRQACHTIIWQE